MFAIPCVCAIIKALKTAPASSGRRGGIMTTGQKIADMRKKTGMKQEELARAVGQWVPHFLRGFVEMFAKYRLY